MAGLEPARSKDHKILIGEDSGFAPSVFLFYVFTLSSVSGVYQFRHIRIKLYNNVKELESVSRSLSYRYMTLLGYCQEVFLDDFNLSNARLIRAFAFSASSPVRILTPSKTRLLVYVLMSGNSFLAITDSEVWHRDPATIRERRFWRPKFCQLNYLCTVRSELHHYQSQDVHHLCDQLRCK